MYYVSVTAAPDPPTALQGTPSTDPAVTCVCPSITFTWAAPNVTNGESDILDYEVTCISAGLPDVAVSSNTTSATVSDLENGATYCCTVTARNVYHSSMPSEPYCNSIFVILQGV